MADIMLTTTDNPFDPFTDFLGWYNWDVAAGYHTCALLARISRSSNELSDLDQDMANESAIDEIIKENISGRHRKVTKDTVFEEG